MSLQKVILYYGFAPVADPVAMKLWQRSLCETLNLKGRILIADTGINGTLGGDMEDLKKYVKATKEYPGFGKIDFKWSDGTGEDFPRLSIKVKPELVAFANAGELKVSVDGVVGGGVHLRPEEVDQLVAERGDEVVFFDGRNAYEAKIGKFKNAIVPDVETSHDFVREIESGKYDHLKEKPVVTYCTGGVRCEILSSVMKNRGFKEVYQIKGGIVRYGEKMGDKGLWEGSLYIFDNRTIQEFSDSPDVIGKCDECGSSTKTFRNCAHPNCHLLRLLCDDCDRNINTPENCFHDRTKKRQPESVG
jgi:UPF0176 protein